MNENDWLLFSAIIYKDTNLAKQAISSGANVNFKYYDNNSALLLASLEMNSETIELLILHGAKVNAVNDYNQAPLYWAIYYGHLKNIEILIRYGAYIDRVNYNGGIWHAAVIAKNFSSEMMEYLYTVDKNINIQNRYGKKTPLHLAVQENKLQAIEFLVNKNADINIKDEDDCTAIDLAVEQENIEIIYILLHKNLKHMTVFLLNKINYRTSYKILQNYFFCINDFSDVQFYKQMKTIYQKLITQHKDLLHAPIAISYRNEQGKRMHGAFYDHYLMRQITKHNTHIIKANTNQITCQSFYNFIPTVIWRLGLDGKEERPEHINENEIKDIDGLIFIPGRPSENGNDFKLRCDFELKQIAQAMLRGQPILAVCAGAWRLFEACVSKITNTQLKESSLVEKSNDHTYSNMPYIVQNGGAGNNVMIHDIILYPNTMLKSIYQHTHRSNLIDEESDADESFIEVNSIHWQAIKKSLFNKQPISSMFTVSAISTGKKNVKNRQGNNMTPDENVVEAFETKTGVPMLGIQWHPEAFFKNQNRDDSNNFHLNIVRNMTLAGDAYHAKRTVLKELENLIQKTDGDCKKILV